MADKQLWQLMQESLDGVLTPEQHQYLDSRLDEDKEEAAEFRRLQQVDTVMSTTPFERAPERLALRIMARILEGVQELRREQQTEISDLALAMTLSTVTTVMLPLLVGACSLVLYAQANPAVLTSAIRRIIILLSLLIKAIQTILDEAESLLKTDPQAARLALALIPMTLSGFVDYMQESFATATDD